MQVTWSFFVKGNIAYLMAVLSFRGNIQKPMHLFHLGGYAICMACAPSGLRKLG